MAALNMKQETKDAIKKFFPAEDTENMIAEKIIQIIENSQNQQPISADENQSTQIIENLKSVNKQLSDDYTTLELSYNNTKEELSNRTNELFKLNEEINQLVSEINTLKQKITDQEKDIFRLETLNNNLQSSINDNNIINWEKTQILFNPIIVDIINKITNTLNQKPNTKSKYTPVQIIEQLIIRLLVNNNKTMKIKFPISDNELLNIAQQTNQNIKTKQQILLYIKNIQNK